MILLIGFVFDYYVDRFWQKEANFIYSSLKWILFWSITTGICGVFLCLRRKHIAITLFVIAIGFHPAKRMLSAFDSKNEDALDKISYVMTNTTPQDQVMDGWTGYGVFRPHAYYYFMLHSQVRAMVKEEEKSLLLDDFISGRINPKLIIFDKDLEAFDSSLTTFINKNYESVGEDPILRRKV